jgi:hypothetical protein
MFGRKPSYFAALDRDLRCEGLGERGLSEPPAGPQRHEAVHSKRLIGAPLTIVQGRKQYLDKGKLLIARQ